MLRFYKGISALLMLSYLAMPASCQTADTEFYGRAMHNGIVMYTEPVPESETIPNNLLHSYYNPRYEAVHDISEGAVFRIKEVNDEWGQIMPDNVYMPFGDGFQDVYVQLDDFEPITDFDPISVYDDTQNQDKLVIVVKKPDPYVILVEQDDIIARVPVMIGEYTPSGEFRIGSVRASRHMPGYPGIPFVAYFTGGMAFHEAYYYNWSLIDKGEIASSGCVNLPDISNYNVIVDGNPMSFAHFFYKWISTNIDYDESVETQATIEWNEEGYYAGTNTVRIIVTDYLQGLKNFALPSRLSDLEYAILDWDVIIDQVTDEWVLPNI